ncbi:MULTISPECIES: 3-isopropylmalate dehydratase small subunit [Microbacterium]|jgi:3-isopropylmalate/(R)-2-methylmalate dehydratase small subunit|uniref:3-isopropylmalate dehydratase small subunit n=1 Tax=Microbacterium TaxID=33882 RepID=UPI0006F529B5|nr:MULTISPECIES: 3-isopropylmalate dehydratase small subunit [Microbacterium]KQP71527.1 isopropylmalate isomerase [Microbacterium sp. Leaf288]MDR7112141.1 3-isopropylmalate/(R)-2-methylmalate dehydratase small subunit [Microbacterium trichothecenolyticum]MDT0142946.1 3-isopropylmalate dehydratase small subunit [Microbacterium sp. PRC9]
MEKFTTHTGIAAPLKRSAVDTDQIIPAVYLKRVTKTGFEDALFASWRQDPEFVLNQPAYAGASILVAGPDFGTGSSREHAVWALRDFGFKVVLSPRFADIFRGNAGKQGLVAGVISEADLEAAWAAIEADPGVSMTVDLDARTARIGALELPFEIDDYTRWRLLEGLDDIGLTLRDADKIAQFEARREAWRPRTLPVP